jgi:Domain of unknown function (DUF1998)
MKTFPKKYRVGDIRPSALMYAFGIGSVVDLPHMSAIVMGLDDWDRLHGRTIDEPRLLRAVREVLDCDQIGELRTPPEGEAPRMGGPRPFDDEARIGVPVATFPRWLVCPYCRLLAPLGSGLFALKPDPFRPDRTKYVHENCNKAPARAPTVVPGRFLVACDRGHLDDFPWSYFVHRGGEGCHATLRMQEFGLSGEAASVSIRCDGCGRNRPMSDAFEEDGRGALPMCRGRRPHLRDFEEGCDRQAQPILLGASDCWFPDTISVLSIPTASAKLPQLVQGHWETLTHATTMEILRAYRKLPQLRSFATYSDEEIWREIQVERAGREDEDEGHVDLLGPEWDIFSSPDPERNSADFSLRRVDVPAGFDEALVQVVLAERLRTVEAFIGFTRMASKDDIAEREEKVEDRRAPISRRDLSWVPAAEVRGEGIFLQFSENQIASWRMRAAVLRRTRKFVNGEAAWRTRRKLPLRDNSFPGMRYVVLHSFAHALMRQLALECGYNAASIRERIYSREASEDEEPMAGILLCTSAPDSEGTLGGLVRLGEPAELGRHITQALELLTLCASDPLCAEHQPGDEDVTLHGAACHACLFVPETSCERGNRYLDRSVLVDPLLGEAGAAFFNGGRDRA